MRFGAVVACLTVTVLAGCGDGGAPERSSTTVSTPNPTGPSGLDVIGHCPDDVGHQDWTILPERLASVEAWFETSSAAFDVLGRNPQLRVADLRLLDGALSGPGDRMSILESVAEEVASLDEDLPVLVGGRSSLVLEQPYAAIVVVEAPDGGILFAGTCGRPVYTVLFSEYAATNPHLAPRAVLVNASLTEAGRAALDTWFDGATNQP